ncbi:MAG TPA: glycosyltransferase family 9 protein [Vicinamibacterales bacterium]|nr:glycosyltransferase family 9 protein [Vicinamibacterales bacterium]
MRTTTIRFLDYWLGIPACGFLSLLRAIRRSFGGNGERQSEGGPQRILFLKFIEQGATVLAQEAIRRATNAVGRDNLYFCVFESNRAILDVLDTVPAANIITIRDRALSTFIVDFLKAAATVRRQRINTVIDMEFFSRASAIFTFLTGAAIRVGLHRFTGELPYRGDLMTHRVQYLPHLHISQQYSVLVEAAFHDPRELPMLKIPLSDIRATPSPPPRFVPDAAEMQRIRQRIGAAEAHPIVILNPNASDLLPLRKWQTEKFKALAERILAAYPTSRIVLTGAPSEREAADRLCREIGSSRATSLAGQTSLRDLLTLYSVADVLVTNDSGPGHFAALTPIRAIVLFGPETPRLFGPLTTASTAIWKELACSPCVSVFNHRLSPCRNNVCMQSITVEEVFEAVRTAVASSDLSPKSPPARTAT